MRGEITRCVAIILNVTAEETERKRVRMCVKERESEKEKERKRKMIWLGYPEEE